SRRRHTRCLSDWSSDVCSSDLESAKPLEQIDEVRSGGSYFSQNDLRVHFGLGKAERVDLVEIRWPSGQIDTIKNVSVNRVIYVKEGAGIVKTDAFTPKA